MKRKARLPGAPTLPAAVAARWRERADARSAALAEPPRRRLSVGLTPKEYGRVLRFQHVLRHVSSATTLVELAMTAGYSDQAHFSREFKGFAGVTPS